MFGRFLLQLNFDSNGCTDTRVANVGQVNFKTESAIKRDQGRSAYFPPYSNAGLRFTDSTNSIKSLLEDPNKEFTIYFNYKINRRYIRRDMNILPIISYRVGNDIIPCVYINKGKNLVLDLEFADQKLKFYSRDISYTFNDRWHNIVITRINNTYAIYIDGVKNTESINYNGVKFGELYVGLYRLTSSNIAKTFHNGCLDDICITDKVNYFENFVPPTLYWKGYDSIDNFPYHSMHNINNLDPDLAFQMEKNREHTVQQIIRNQAGNIPYRMKIEWYTDNEYFINDTELVRVRDDKRTYTVLRIFMVENLHMFVDNTERFGEWDAFTEVSIKYTMWPFVLFINKKFIALSRIKIIKSDHWYTFIIQDLPATVKVTDVKMLFIPFRCLYEEYRGERPDKQVLYSFKENGKFATDGADFYYYLDDIRNPNLKCSGIRREVIPDSILKYEPPGSGPVESTQLMHYSWRYGNFETKRNDGTSTYVYFMAWDNGFIKPGDEVLLYAGTTLIDKVHYRVVGYDLLEFFNYYTLGIENKLITMCIITDNREDEWLFQDYTDTKIVQVTATQNNQNVFKIPDVSDDMSVQFDKFLLFKGSVCLENYKRYKINYENGTVILLHPSDWMALGRNLTFVFVRLHKGDEWGPFWMKPIFQHIEIAVTDTINGFTTANPLKSFDLPEPQKYKYSMSNTMLYVHDTFIPPQRYRIVNNKTVEFVQPGDGLLGFPNITIVLIKMATQLEKDTARNKMVIEQYRKGKRFVLTNTGIDKKRKITLENITAFDQNGEYVDDLMGYIYNMNVIKQLYTSDPMQRVVESIQIIYHDWSEENYANITLPDNDNYIKNYLCMFTEFEELDKHFDAFISEYEDKYRKYFPWASPKIQYQYGVNLAKELQYQTYYNQDKFDAVYERKRTVTRKTFNKDTMNAELKLVNGRYTMSIPQNTKWFINNIYDTYSLFFRNGYLIDHEQSVKYVGNECKLSLPSKLTTYEWFESIDCHKQLNKLDPIPYGIKNFNPPPSINYIPNPYSPSGTNIYKDINTTVIVQEHHYQDILNISVKVDWFYKANIAINELPPDRIKEFGINLHISADWQKDPLMTISITTWTDPPPYVPPAGWKGPEYYDIYMKITTTT